MSCDMGKSSDALSRMYLTVSEFHLSLSDVHRD